MKGAAHCALAVVYIALLGRCHGCRPALAQDGLTAFSSLLIASRALREIRFHTPVRPIAFFIIINVSSAIWETSRVPS
jgi:hypothetical protein